MPPRPRRRQNCPQCRQPMSWFGDHWKCVNIKAHDRSTGARKGTHGRQPPRGKKKAGKK